MTDSRPPEDSAATPQPPNGARGEAASTVEPQAQPPVAPTKKRGRWRRRLWWSFVTLVVIAVILRVTLWLALPSILRSSFADYDLGCEYERLHLNLLTGDLELWHLNISPRRAAANDSADGTTAVDPPASDADARVEDDLVELEYCRADVAIAQLFFGRLVVRRVEVDGMDVLIERDATGAFPGLERFLRRDDAPPEPEPTTTEERAADEAQLIDLALPFELNALRLQHVQTRFRDLSVSPPIDTRLDLNLRISNLGSTARPTRFDLAITSPPLFESLRVEALGTSNHRKLDYDFKVVGRGLQPKSLAGYLHAAGARAHAQSIDFGFDGAVHLEALPAPDSTTDAAKSDEPTEPGTAVAGSLELSGLTLQADGNEAASLGRLIVTIAELTKRHLTIEETSIAGVSASAARQENGALEVAGLQFGGATSSDVDQPDSYADAAAATDVVVRDNDKASSSDGSAAPTPENETGASGDGDGDGDAVAAANDVASTSFTVTLKRLSLEDFAGLFDDHSTQPATHLEARLVSSTLDIDSKPDTPEQNWNLRTQLSFPDVAGSVELNGSGRFSSSAASLSLSLAANGIAPDAVTPYLTAAGLTHELEDGALTCSLSADFERTAERVQAAVRLKDLIFQDGPTRHAALDRIEVSGIQIAPLESASNPTQAQDSSTATEAAATQTTTRRLAIDIDAIEIVGLESAAARSEDGVLSALGIRVLPNGVSRHDSMTTRISDAKEEAAPNPVAATAANRETKSGAEGAPHHREAPRLHVGRIQFAATELAWTDEAVQPAAKLQLVDLELGAADVTVDAVTAASDADAAAQLKGGFRLPGAVENFTLDGELRGLPQHPALSMTVDADGITAAALQPYLEQAGLASALTAGRLQFSLRAAAQPIASEDSDDDAGTAVRLSLEGVRLTDGEAELVAIERLAVEDVVAQRAALRIGNVELVRPRANVERRPDGSIAAAGLILAPPQSSREGPDGANRDSALSPTASQASDRTPPQQIAATKTDAASDETAANVETRSERPEAASIQLERLRVEAARVDWADAVVTPAVDTHVRVDVAVDQLDIGAASPKPGSVDVRVAIADTLDELSLKGNVTLGLDEQSTQLAFVARGLRAGAMAPYLEGSGIDVTLADGQLKADLGAVVGAAADGGQRLAAEISAFNFHDQAAPDSPLLELDSLRVEVARFDPQGGFIEVDEVALDGLASRMHLRVDGGIDLLGLRLTAAQPSEANRGERKNGDETSMHRPRGDVSSTSIEHAAKATAGAVPEGQPSAVAAGAVPTAATSLDAAPVTGVAGQPAAAAQATIAAAETTAVQALRSLPPLVRLARCDLNLRRFVIRSEAEPDGDAIEVKDVRLHNPDQIELLGPEPDQRDPAVLELRGEVSPLVSEFMVRLESAPFAIEPHAAVDVLVTGIEGSGLLRAFPSLSSQLDGDGLNDGRFAARIETTLRARRRHALDFDFRNGFGADLTVKGVRLTSADEPRALAGLESLQVDLARFDPTSGNVHIKLIEMTKPQGLLRYVEEGIEAAGLTLKLAAAAPEDATDATEDTQQTEETGEPDKTAATEEPEGATATSEVGDELAASEARGAHTEERDPANGDSANQGGDTAGDVSADGRQSEMVGRQQETTAEIRVDQVLVSGIDFLFEDLVSDPPMQVPLTELDLEVRGATTRALSEPLPIRFSAVMGSGKVELPSKANKGMLVGAVSDAVAVISGDEVDSTSMEARPFFEEIVLSGRLVFSPKLQGWVKAGISALELTNLRGPAAAAGMTLSDGLFDTGVTVRIKEDGTIDTNSRVRFTDLGLSEGPDGPIFRYLHLPAPLDVVLFVLRDENGALDLSVPVSLPGGEFSAVQATGAAVGALNSLIGNAIQGSAFRAAGALGGLVGLGGDEEEVEDEATVVTFAPGGTVLDIEGRNALQPLLERLDDDDSLVLTLRHDVGGGDVTTTHARVNPSRQDTLDLLARLRRKRDTLTAARQRVAAEARAALTSGLSDAAEQLRSRVGAFDLELGFTEQALDRILELLRPGAERHGMRRTKEACVALGITRLLAVREALLTSGYPEIEKRLRLRRPRFGEPAGADGGQVSLSISSSIESEN